MNVLNTTRIVLLGKTGAGKSSLANNIFGEAKFQIHHFNDFTMHCSLAETASVNGRSLTLIDTPGFFDPGRSEEDMKPEILRCITECSPGPHAFLIVLKVEKFTEHEQAVITQMCEYFSEDALRYAVVVFTHGDQLPGPHAFLIVLKVEKFTEHEKAVIKQMCEYFSEDVLKYAVVVFTHGDQLPEGQKIEEFFSPSEGLSDLVKKCGGRCHVVDNKYWKNNQQGEYRSNQFQVEELLKTIDKIVIENNGGYYSNDLLQAVENEIQEEEEEIRQNSGNMSVEEIRIQAESKVFDRFLTKLEGIAMRVLLCAWLGVVKFVRFVKALFTTDFTTAAGGAGAAAGGAGAAAGVVAAAGGVIGGMMGHKAAERAETPQEAAQMAFNSVIEKRKAKLKQL